MTYREVWIADCAACGLPKLQHCSCQLCGCESNRKSNRNGTLRKARR